MRPKLLPDGAPRGRRAARDIALDQDADDLVGAVEAIRDRPDSTSVLAGLGVPLVMAVGEHDPFISVDEARASGGRVQVFDGVGTFAALERPKSSTCCWTSCCDRDRLRGAGRASGHPALIDVRTGRRIQRQSGYPVLIRARDTFPARGTSRSTTSSTPTMSARSSVSPRAPSSSSTATAADARRGLRRRCEPPDTTPGTTAARGTSGRACPRMKTRRARAWLVSVAPRLAQAVLSDPEGGRARRRRSATVAMLLVRELSDGRWALAGRLGGRRRVAGGGGRARSARGVRLRHPRGEAARGGQPRTATRTGGRCGRTSTSCSSAASSSPRNRPRSSVAETARPILRGGRAARALGSARNSRAARPAFRAFAATRTFRRTSTRRAPAARSRRRRPPSRRAARA